MIRKKMLFSDLCIVLLLSCAIQSAQAAEQKTYTNSMGMEFVLIPAGSFSLEKEVIKKNQFGEVTERYTPRVTVSKPFYLGKYLVTQEQWVALMGDNPSHFKGRQKPVEWVNWKDVQEFIKRLNAKEGTNRYRLPTEMEWELAARGGTDTKFFFMKDPQAWEGAEDALAEYAWFAKNAGHTGTQPVGQKKPNPYGLYDIYGNVEELVQDWCEKLPTDREIIDYRGKVLPQKIDDAKLSGYERQMLFKKAIESGGLLPGEDPFPQEIMARGGSWLSSAEGCRSGRVSVCGRGASRSNVLGFRLALSPE